MRSSSKCDPTRTKAQLRLAAQRLAQLQDRKDSLAHITSKDIATLLGQRNVSLARTKAQNLMQEDAVSKAMEALEMYCGLLFERFSELEKGEPQLHSSTVEALATIIYAAPLTGCQELALVRGLLMEHLGPGFSQSVLQNSDGHVSQRVLRLMHSSPSADDIDAYLFNIACKFGVDWKPRMKADQKLAILSEILDDSDIMSTVNLLKLREIASSGIPVDPSWIRPRVWKLLLGITPLLKVQWQDASRKKREAYYDLVQRLLINVVSLPLPTDPLSPRDKALVSLAESLSRVPVHLFHGLTDEMEQLTSCPLHESASADVKIDCAFALDTRLQLIQGHSSNDNEDSSFSSTPEIRLDTGSAPSSPQESSFDPSEAVYSVAQQQSKMLSLSSPFAPKIFRNIPAHPSHVSSLLRLLFIHKSLNPGAESPHLASLLVPLYTVMNQEVEPTEVAHAEADTFWLFEVLIREVSELEETEAGLMWMKRFRERLSMADNELLEDLILKGLDPGLPQYSYRWLASVLTHALPVPDVLTAWDAIFAQEELTRQSNPRLEHLLDICTAMLVRARARLLSLGRRSPSLWEVEPSGIERQALRPWELGDAFMEGITFLQNYPIESAGGMERVLQVAGDTLLQREQLAKASQVQNTGLGSMIRDKLWRGITNQSAVEGSSPENSEEESEDDTETESEHPQDPKPVSRTSSTSSGWSSYLKTAVIRGITNESAMDPESPGTSPMPSPILSPTRPVHELPREAPQSPTPVEKSPLLSVPGGGPGLWGYAKKLSQSDMAAKLSKASTNLSAKAMDVWSTRSASTGHASISETQTHIPTVNIETSHRSTENSGTEIRRSSVLNIHQPDHYSPPPRPAFFKPPRDTRLFSSEEVESLGIPDSPESGNSSLSASTLSAGGHGRTASITSALPSWASGQSRSSKPKSAPKPLLLSASSLVTAGSTHISRSANSTPIPRHSDWSEVRSSSSHSSPQRRDSQFSELSVSSRHSSSVASPRDGRNGWDSDQSVSRVVRLNRQSVSPMAPAFRINRSSSRNASMSSQSELGVLHYRTGSEYKTAPEYRTASEGSPKGLGGRIYSDEIQPPRNWDRVSPDSPSTLPSSPPPRTPITNTGSVQSSVRVANAERQRGSLVLSESGLSGADVPTQSKKTPRKPSSPTVVPVDDTSDSSLPPGSPLSRNTPRVRSKRFNGTKIRPPSLRTRLPEGRVSSISTTSPSTLAAPVVDAELDMATTPRAAQFPSTSPTIETQPRSPRHRKISTEGPESRRKLSGETNGTRTRKISGESKPARTRKVSGESYSRRDSHANDGDDEGYDELLSAYESETSKDESASSEA